MFFCRQWWKSDVRCDKCVGFMGCPNKVIHVTYGAPLFLRQRTYEGEWERWEGSRVKRPGWLWFRCNRTGQLRVGNHLTVKAFEYEGMERLANLKSNWIKEGPEVNVVLSHPVYHIQYCYLLYRSHTVSTRGSRMFSSYLFVEEREC